MKSLKSLKKRLKTVKSTSQITRALQMVSTSKMKKAQQIADFIKIYQQEIRNLIHTVAINITDKKLKLDNPRLKKLLTKRKDKKILLVLFAPTKGFCGSLISNLLSFTYDYVSKLKSQKYKIDAIGLQQKSRYILEKIDGINIDAIFERPIENPTLESVAGEFKMAIDYYLDKQVSQIVLVYPQFINTFTYKPVAMNLLPLDPDKLIERHNIKDKTNISEPFTELIIEPSPQEFLLKAVERFLEVEFLSAIAHTKASEHSARMIAMKNATDNAESLNQNLRLQFNRLRQESITNELLDIIGGTLK